MRLKKVLGILLGLLGLSFAGNLNIKNLDLSQKEIQLFIKAYTLGRQDAERDFNFFEKKTLSYLKDIYITKKLIKAGDLRIIVKTQIQPLGDNQFRVVKVFTFKVVNPQDLAKNKAFLERIEQKAQIIDRLEGYWVYMKISNVPEPIQGLIEFALLKEGLKPLKLGNVLIAGIFSRKADAEMWKKLLKEKYNLDFAIAEVNKGKSLDPVIQNLINELN
jgi:hypothetical protein